MRTLIALLEQAREGSRELDAKIHHLLWPEHGEPNFVAHDGTGRSMGRVLGWCQDAKGLQSCSEKYTTSLDAALTLVPEGWRVHEFQQADDDRWRCMVARKAGKGGTSGPATRWFGSAALALCIAALKAREQADD